MNLHWGDAVTLEATSEGVTNPEFRFGRKYTGGSWHASSWSTTATREYPTTQEDAMEFAVQVREAGGSRLAQDLVAEMTGSISGEVFEERDFSIPGAGIDPVYGKQTGEGTVLFEHSDLGELTFEVDIELDKFDEQGRAIAGTVDAIEYDQGYSCKFIFLEDGTREGELYLNDELVGKLTMTVDHDKFENYVDLETGETIDLPDPSEGF